MDEKAAFYRRTALGKSFLAALEEIQRERQLSEEELTAFLALYDEVFENELGNATEEYVLKGTVQQYQNLDGTWTLVLKKASVSGRGDKQRKPAETLHVAAFNEK
eukprot:CAMPEP_0201510082 /NCGR_PEP_ID=MMETSP0161_2-20130828/2924_1 /ASSEMBLY_ACC=CAM_ASM_000251 /TAXON_ID=180227 /ORGANISM="Neoparamoeba aestuarina, Strain SoJaBio B1-5/56/2" /LENGTH=104 /DNA_ID=CAMNT_0047905205 /DNA_START=188 /DNA_END=502 /DNA_ORIENTATION=-